MRTIFQETATSKTLTLVQSPLPTPNLDNHEHLIQVKACSPCSGELLWPANFPPANPRPLIPCPDIAGTIISAPTDSPFQPGDSVYARTNYTRPGNARDYTIAVTDELAHIPQALSFVQAAAVPVSAETAWQILFEHGISQEGKGDGEVDWETARQFWGGKRVLVTAASGGVGMWVVQLAGLLGAEVIGTCGAGNLEFVQSLGAQALDYRVVDLKAWAVSREVDVVVDCVGGRALGDAWWTVRDGGVVLSIYQPPLMVRPEGFKRVVRDVFFVMGPVGRQLEEISKLIEGGKCHGMVDSVWPLEQFEEAFKRLDGGHAKGKIVFDLSLNQ
jgi:NADPH:quinone reductase-like Zn-dependent oxidoreductase